MSDDAQDRNKFIERQLDEALVQSGRDTLKHAITIGTLLNDLDYTPEHVEKRFRMKKSQVRRYKVIAEHADRLDEVKRLVEAAGGRFQTLSEIENGVRDHLMGGRKVKKDKTVNEAFSEKLDEYIGLWENDIEEGAACSVAGTIITRFAERKGLSVKKYLKSYGLKPPEDYLTYYIDDDFEE